MRQPPPRIGSTCVLQQINRLIPSTRQKLTRAQCPIGNGNVWITRTKPDRLFKCRDAHLRLTEIQSRLSEMQIGPGVVRVERNRRLELALSFGQAVLDLTKKPERKVSLGPVRNTSPINGFRQ